MSSGSIATEALLLCCASTQVNEAISTLAAANALGFTRTFMCSSSHILALAGAISAEQVRQRVVAFVARVLVDGAGRPRHGQLTSPRLRERRRVVDLEPIEQGIGIEK